MFRSLELIGLVTNIEKLILFDLVNFAPKQPSPTDSRAVKGLRHNHDPGFEIGM